MKRTILIILLIIVAYACNKMEAQSSEFQGLEQLRLYDAFTPHLVITCEQPTVDELENLLEKYNISMIIRLNGEHTTLDPAKENEVAWNNDVLYKRYNIHAKNGINSRVVDKIHSAINNAGGPILLHCEHGYDRTGTIMSTYLIKYTTMRRMGLSPILQAVGWNSLHSYLQAKGSAYSVYSDYVKATWDEY